MVSFWTTFAQLLVLLLPEPHVQVQGLSVAPRRLPLPASSLFRRSHRGGGTSSLLLSNVQKDASGSTLFNPSGGSNNPYTDDDLVARTSTDVDNQDQTFRWTPQWYPVLPVSYLRGMVQIQPNQPLAFPLLGRDLVVWKSNDRDNDDNDEQWSVMEDVCPHRQAPLSTGKICQNSDTASSNTIMCRFHGWQFAPDGACTDIPMHPDNHNASHISKQSVVRKFRASSYPTRVAGGLLWFFLGDTNDHHDTAALPEIAPDALLPDALANTVEWSVYSFPVSYMSMVENSFDPSHAPFVHEGIAEFGGSKYSPREATPMTMYQLLDHTSVSGFRLRHSPYTRQHDANNTTYYVRQFLPPAAQKTSFPMFDVHLYFIPRQLRETLVMSAFPLPQLPFQTYMPARVLQFLKDLFHVVYLTNSQRFQLQDTLTMRRQDTIKLRRANMDPTKVTMDRVPSPADAGVKTFQTWIRKYAGGPPMSDPFARVTLESLAEPKLGSVWERHGHHCPRCNRSVRHLDAIARLTNRASKLVLLATSAAWGAVSMWNKKGKTTSAVLLVVGVLVSLFLKTAEQRARGIVEKLHQPQDEVDLADVYQY